MSYGVALSNILFDHIYVRCWHLHWWLSYIGFIPIPCVINFRSFIFIQALIEKDWLAFGHPFSDRIGMPTIFGSSNVPFELSRQSSVGSFPSSPMRQASGSFTTQAPSSSHAQNLNNYSPIFLQVCAFILNSGRPKKKRRKKAESL